jgi:hypothetical protein
MNFAVWATDADNRPLNAAGEADLFWQQSANPDEPVGSLRRTGAVVSITAGPVIRMVTWLDAWASLVSGGHGDSAGLAGAIDADFSHTGRIEYIRAFDASGIDITDQITATSGSGTVYRFGAQTSVVPEPGTWVLVGAGLLTLAAGVRRHAGPLSVSGASKP